MRTNMDYSKEWIIGEQIFDSNYLGKCESVMCLGNGYMGLRSTTEERYLTEKRNLFVAGTFNKFDETEVTELPNVPDVVAMDIYINNQLFTLERGSIRDYKRELNLRTGELSRSVIWTAPMGEEILFEFKRIVSMAQLHTIAQQVTIRPLNQTVDLKIVTGIDGTMTNSGSQHFSEGEKRFYDRKYMQYIGQTTESKIAFVLNTGISFGEAENSIKSLIIMDRRKIMCEYKGKIEKDCTLVMEKISNIYTTRDKENKEITIEQLQQLSLDALKKDCKDGYFNLAKDSAHAWESKVWAQVPITIQSKNKFDQLAIRFAQYHLYIMTPAHDNRMNIGAKGLSGEGYKGHTFWDTDIFVLPYFTFTDPDIARSLVEYRYLSLPGAHKKAADNQYEGAQFPWESAWLDDGEVTPVWGAADIITGLPTKIWSGFIEQHITSDVAYGVWQYYIVSGDEKFMNQYGYELIMDTAKFWVSRLEWSEEDHKYHINDVIGADEYKEHVNDNAYTNYMAYWNIKKAIEYYDSLKETSPELFTKLYEKLGLERVYPCWCEYKDLIYLPQPRKEDLVIPQDATYLSLKDIDLSKYKNQEQIGSMFLDYNLEQVNQIQVSKQADIMILFYLMEDLFSLEVKKANWNYYEPRTLHDSSLSLSTHTILACDMKNKELAYQLFQDATQIDIGMNMKSSDAGIHAASIAGIWQSTVFGFGGVRMLNGSLRICPFLPENWSSLQFYIYWKTQKLNITITKTTLSIVNETNTIDIVLEVYGKEYTIKGKQEIEL